MRARASLCLPTPPSHRPPRPRLTPWRLGSARGVVGCASAPAAAAAAVAAAGGEREKVPTYARSHKNKRANVVATTCRELLGRRSMSPGSSWRLAIGDFPSWPRRSRLRLPARLALPPSPPRTLCPPPRPVPFWRASPRTSNRHAGRIGTTHQAPARAAGACLFPLTTAAPAAANDDTSSPRRRLLPASRSPARLQLRWSMAVGFSSPAREGVASRDDCRCACSISVLVRREGRG